MKTHIIKNGSVVNTIVATVEEAQLAFPEAVCIDGSVGGIGWEWDADAGELIVPAGPEPDFNAERESNIQSGMPYVFPDGQSGIVDIRSDRDIINIIGLGVGALQLYLSSDTTTLLTYRDEANVNHDMTASETIAFGMTFMSWYSQKYKESWNKKDNK